MLVNKNPKLIEKILLKSVMGQDEAVRTVAIAISAHLLRVNYNQENPSSPVQKDNLLLLGPTGCGKTESFRSVIRECNLPVPIAVIDASSLTASGYKGKNTDDILIDLVRDAIRIINIEPSAYIGYTKDDEERKKLAEKEAVKLANTGIIILDEFDKLRIDPYKDENENYFPRAAQRQLLKMIEGGTGFGDNSPGNLVDTTNILFVATGAFVGMDEVIRKRLQPAPAVKARIGFTNDGGDRSASTGQDTGEIPVSGVVPTAADLIDYGFIPELVGRLPLRCRYNELSESSLYSILSESAISPVKGFQKLFGMNGNWLAFTSNALKCIARQAYDEHMGARGLQEVVGKIVYPVLYELSETNGMHVLITTDTIMNGKPPVIKKLGSDGRQGAPAGTGRPGHAARKYNW